jgi:sugar phosphate isomerase/epimerase
MAVRFSLSGATAGQSSFSECVNLCLATGMEGMGFHEDRLDDDASDLELFRSSGLKATTCAPETFSILPLPRWPGPDDPSTRIDLICRGVQRLAPFDPNSCTVLTGPAGRYGEEEAREIVVNGYRRIAREAAELSVTIALEPFHYSFRNEWTLVTTLPEMAALLEEIGEPNTAMLFDVWHLWDSPDLLSQIREYARRFVGAHVNDWRDPTRGWCDRVLPGDGIADLHGIFRALDEGGFDGWLDLEVISDDGTFGTDYPDSLWKLDPAELVRAGRERMILAWQDRWDASSR